MSPGRQFIIGILLGIWGMGSSCSDGKPEASSKITLPLSAGTYGMWDLLGYQKDQKVTDFTIYSQEGEPFNLYTELKKGKPLLLINGSYTCDVSRANLSAINSMSKRYKDDMGIFMVYTIDAHPIDTISPYSAEGEIWIAKNNIRDSVEARQPKTYSERVALSRAWKEKYDIVSPVLVDNPDNEYWLNFGQAPNMAYVIEPEGTIYYKQAWFEEEALDQQIQALLEP